MSVSRFELCAVQAKRGRWLCAVGLALAGALSGCATPTAQQHYAHGHEYFSQAKYGHASPKVIADGQPVPRGGGQYLVGHPYTIAGHTYYPSETESYTAVGMASWYGAAFHGRRTANGEVYDMASLTAAHPTLPLPCYARVTNLSNGYSVIVRVNDRGPYHGGRVMDVSSRTADVLDFKGSGTAKIKVEYVGRAPLEGSDDATLLASLRTDGSPANLNGYSSPVMVASESPAEPGPSAFMALMVQARAVPPQPPAPEPPPQPEPVRVAAAEPEPQPAARARNGEAVADGARIPASRGSAAAVTALRPWIDPCRDRRRGRVAAETDAGRDHAPQAAALAGERRKGALLLRSPIRSPQATPWTVRTGQTGGRPRHRGLRGRGAKSPHFHGRLPRLPDPVREASCGASRGGVF